MSTQALFRDDAYLRECTAVITRIGPEGIELDRTVFYPLGGGQAADHGSFLREDGSHVRIVDARKSKEPGATPDDVIHVPDPTVVPAIPLQVGETVVAQIDWDRRFRHMRFHTSTHLLCAVVRELVDGCSITMDYARLDFAMTETLDRDAVERGLRALVAAAKPVSTRWVTDEVLQSNPDLVKSMSVSPPLGFGRVRLVDVSGIDLQACGGTHVANTAEIGAVIVTKIEKKSARTRRVVLGIADS